MQAGGVRSSRQSLAELSGGMGTRTLRLCLVNRKQTAPLSPGLTLLWLKRGRVPQSLPC